MPRGVEEYGNGYRACLHIRTCTFPTAEDARRARGELVAMTKRMKTSQKIAKLRKELAGLG